MGKNLSRWKGNFGKRYSPRLNFLESVEPGRCFISETAHLSRMQILKSSKGRSVENDTVVTPYETHNIGTKESYMTLSSDPLYDYGYEEEKEYKYTSN